MHRIPLSLRFFLLPFVAMAIGLLSGCSDLEAGLHAAIAKGEIGNVRRLLDAGADAMAPGGDPVQTPLEAATRAGRHDVVEALLAHGALADSAVGGESPLRLALVAQHDSIAAALVSAGAVFVGLEVDGVAALRHAANAGMDLTLIAMLGKGADPATPFEGGTLLHAAVRGNNLALVEALLKAGAELEARDSLGRTALHAAAEAGQAASVDALLKRGASHQARAASGDVPLGLAAMRGDSASIVVLLAADASPLLGNAQGEMPLHLAALHSRLSVAQLLIGADAPVNARTRYGATPARIAWELGDRAMADLLAENGGRLR